MAFWGCNNLKEIVIQDGADHIEIGSGAFEFCSRLERITIPESMVDIEGFSFDESWKLKEICGPERILEKLYREGLIVTSNYFVLRWGRERCDRKGHVVFLRP